MTPFEYLYRKDGTGGGLADYIMGPGPEHEPKNNLNTILIPVVYYDIDAPFTRAGRTASKESRVGLSYGYFQRNGRIFVSPLRVDRLRNVCNCGSAGITFRDFRLGNRLSGLGPSGGTGQLHPRSPDDPN